MLGNGYILTLNILYGIQNRFMSCLRIGILCISKAVKVGKGKYLFKISFCSQYLYEPFKRDRIIIEYLIVVMVSLGLIMTFC